MRVSTDDVFKAVRNLLDKEILADIADLKVRRPKRQRGMQRIKKEPKQADVPKIATEE